MSLSHKIKLPSANHAASTYHMVILVLQRKLFVFEVKTSLAAFWQGKILWVGVINTLVARALSRIEDLICFQEALIKFSKLGFPVVRGEFLRQQYEDYI